MSKKILGLDLGSNSIGWALLNESAGNIDGIIAIGSRIFTRAVAAGVPTPKNVKRRDSRLGRRVVQRRARRKERMLNYLVLLNLLPRELQGNTQPEIILNKLGDPYQLRTKALDHQLDPHEFGRILLHFVARRGFLSNKKQVAGDLIDDPDTVAFLNELDAKPAADEEERAFNAEADKEEKEFHADITEVRKSIDDAGARTLGEYLYKLNEGVCKRNREHEGRHLRTDRKMYQDELDLIWQQQSQYFSDLPDEFMEKGEGIKDIIFYQRPLKLNKNKIGKCTFEVKKNRALKARLEYQRFRYLQDVNNLEYRESKSSEWVSIKSERRAALIEYFEKNKGINITDLRVHLGFAKRTEINLETKNLKGNITACEIRAVLNEQWDNYSKESQDALVEDFISIKTKTVLKKRLINHWKFDTKKAIALCLLEFEPGHGKLSLKAINKLLPFLEKGSKYSKKDKEIDKETGELGALGALQAAGYAEDIKVDVASNKLGAPTPTTNPIVDRGMHELKRVINAIIKEYGKPDVIRIEMARDLEMTVKRYKENEKRVEKNTKANKEAIKEYKELGLGDFPSHDEKIKHRLWIESGKCCAYSNKTIPLNVVFTPDVEIDHILPFKKSLDDSYMNKMLCYAAENRSKGDRTPIDAWGGNTEKWGQITKAISKWKGVDSKVKRFYRADFASEKQKDFISSQLNDTRYISVLALNYVRQLGCDVSVTKGYVVSKIRHQWGFNSLISENHNTKTDKKDRTNHGHHAIDAVVIAATSRELYTKAVKQIKNNKIEIPVPYPGLRDELAGKLKDLIISHQPSYGLSGELHEETATNYIEAHKGLVYRKTLSPEFKEDWAKIIVDETVQEQVLSHLAKNGNDPKKAFASDKTVYHKDGKTPIKRVRVLQRLATPEFVEENRFGVKDKSGNIFKYLKYGKYHHVEIIRHKTTGKYKGEFVTMMEASHRLKGIKSKLNPDGLKQNMTKIDHGEEWEFLMALHTNDLVSVTNENNKQDFYRIQKLDASDNRFVLRENRASTLGKKEEKLVVTISNKKFEQHNLKLHKVNSIGMLLND